MTLAYQRKIKRQSNPPRNFWEGIQILLKCEKSPLLTLKRPGGGFPPQDIRAIAMFSGTKLWLLNLHVIIIFDVYNNWEKNLGGLYKKNLKNFAFEKNFFL